MGTLKQIGGKSKSISHKQSEKRWNVTSPLHGSWT